MIYMKKLAFLLIAILLLGASAMAEGNAMIMKDTPVSIDLDGDGRKEIVEWGMFETDYEPALSIRVDSADGYSVHYDTDILYGEEVYAADIDSDGRTEILITGDVMSDDYVTYCLRYDDGLLYELLFADASRGENADCYYKAGYGLITDMGGGTITLAGSQDVLGTWMARREFTLAPSGRFELSDDGIWVREVDFSNAEIWEYGALTLKTNLDATLNNGDSTYHTTLKPGDKIVITASNKEDLAWFMTEDGAEGMVSISKNHEAGWGYCVNDIPEDELFEYIPYAD